MTLRICSIARREATFATSPNAALVQPCPRETAGRPVGTPVGFLGSATTWPEMSAPFVAEKEPTTPLLLP